MEKIVFLLPPSEWKISGWDFDTEKLSFSFMKPYNIGSQATQRDLKCKWKRYEQAITLNNNIDDGPFHKAIDRYSWVMYDAIDHRNMDEGAQSFFNENFLIFSWMYGLLKPFDTISNYKLPIEATWLRHFWQEKITEALNDIQPTHIVNLLPGAYQKMVDLPSLNSKIIHVNFFTEKDDRIVKLAHGVKKIKWEWIKNICENGIEDYNDFWWQVEEKWGHIHVHILHS